MALNKSTLNINFAQGLNTKSDDKQVPPGQFLALENSVFTKAGLLQKRAGYGFLPALPDDSSTYLTTFSGNLTAVGENLRAYSSSTQGWVNKGPIHPGSLDTSTLIRSNTNQSQADSVVAANGLVCTVYTDNVPVSGSNVAVYKYAIADVVTGQNIVAPAVIPVPTGTVSGAPRVFLLGRYFVIVFDNLITATHHLYATAINTVDPTVVVQGLDLSAQYVPATTIAFDGIVTNDTLFFSWCGSDGSVKVSSLSSTLVQSNTVSFTSKVGTLFTLAADTSPTIPVIYVNFYNSGTGNAFALAVDSSLNTVLAPVATYTSATLLNLASTGQNGVCSLFAETDAAYSYDSAIKTNYIALKTITQAGTVSSPTNIVRSLGLASKAFLIDSTPYMLGVYSSSYQPTYFLINSSGNVVFKLAYSNSGPYYTHGLPNVSVADNTVKIPYLYKDLIQSVNKSQGATTATGVYAQTGVNLLSFQFGSSDISVAETANDLHLSGGFLWMYDGYSPVEHSFHLWPDYVEVVGAVGGGSMTAQQYFYVATYEWADNQGNIFRSAPSLPVSVTLGATGHTTVNVPTLRLTYKTANPAKIVIYRWSVAQQTYYQVTSVLTPVLNSTTTDSIAFTDTQADSAIIGNNILYTTGGVLENIAAPATNVLTLFDNRLWAIDAEDGNTLWFSRQVIPTVPVEMSDLLTVYVAPTAATAGAPGTGKLKALSALDDKLIMFKTDAIYYLNGTGPDNTGANNQYSQPTFVTSVVGCANQSSIVFMPNGLMFESDKGIWLLGRDLSTSYIGAPVEAFTQGATVQSAVNVPGTNEVRFTMSSGITLMYDYYYGQWGTFTNVAAISSTIYQGQHTYINSRGAAYQQTPDLYVDGSSPVLMSFTTSWLNIAGVQGFERAYHFYLIGKYLSPHKLNCSIAYDYNPSPTQVTQITPDNYSGPWGSDSTWGGSTPWGGAPNLEQWRVFLQQQKCEAFQVTVKESYDPSYGVAAGAGFTLSGLDLIIGQKSGYPRLRAARSVG